MTFEEDKKRKYMEDQFTKDFPSLKGKETMLPVNEIIKKVLIKENVAHIYKEDILVFPMHMIQEHCIDKQKKHHFTSDEITELMAKGEVITVDGLKLSALSKPSSPTMQRFKEEHILLYDYKAKVKEVLDKYIPTLPENKNHPSFDKYNTIKDIVLKIKKELEWI